MFRSPEQAQFSALVSQHIASGTAPLLLEGGTGLGKTRAYLHALIQSGKQVTIILPTHQLIDQLLASSDLLEAGDSVSVAAFRPARAFLERGDYEANRRTALSAQVMVCTASSVMIDQRLQGGYNGATLRDYLLFDEADQLPDLAALHADLRISKADQQRFKVPDGATCQEVVDLILANPAKAMEPELRAAAGVIQESMENPASGAYANIGFNDEGDLVMLHRLPGRLLKRVSNQAKVAFISATLSINGKFNDFQRAMGIQDIDVRSGCIEPAKHGSLEFFIEHLEVDTPEWHAAIVQAAGAAPKPVLVVTPSHELAQQVGTAIPGAVTRGKDETAADAAKRVAHDGVLVAAAAWAGLDTPLRWRSIIVPRVPYPQLQTVAGSILTSYLDSRNTAVRRLKQVIGRGLRSPDAECQVIILDSRAHKLTGFVPERFLLAWNNLEWLEGGRRTLILSKVERDPAVRAAALKHYGHKCMALKCTSTIKLDSQLHVHHRDPIAEGIRKTTLADVMVLCACCHELAHARHPPYQLDIELGPAEK